MHGVRGHGELALSDFDALYAAVLARPHDDTPRLVMADYLDDQSDTFSNRLGRFIRTQYAIASFPYDDAESLAPLIRQERELWGTWPETDDVRSWVHTLRPRVSDASFTILPYSMRSCGAELLARHGFVDVVRGSKYWLLGDFGGVGGGESDAPAAAILPWLTKGFPIREVQLSDFTPLEWSDGESPYFTVHPARPAYNREFCVPKPVWVRLAGRWAGGNRRYDSEAEALADVSRAALEWAAAEGRE